MKIAVCDDQIEFQNIILEYLDILKRADMDISTYNSGENLIEAVRNNYTHHIMFLDIQMKRMNGIETAEEIRKYDEKVIIIFITSHPDFAIDGYNVSALHYLLKPVTFKQFEKVFNKALNSLDNLNKKVILNVGRKLISVDVNSILYIESNGREVYFYTDENIYKTSSSLSSEQERLQKFDFVQSHRCYSVNLAHVKEIEKDNVCLKNNERVPLSRNKYKVFYSKYLNYVLR